VRAEHLARKRLLARVRVLPNRSQLLSYEEALTLTLRCAPDAIHLLALTSCSTHFERSRATLARVPVLRYVAAAAAAGSQWTGEHARICATGGADVRAGAAKEAVCQVYAAFGAIVLRCGSDAYGEEDLALRDGVGERRVGDALYRFASLVEARAPPEARAELCARTALAAAPPGVGRWRALAGLNAPPGPPPPPPPAAGRWPAGARPPHDCAVARARREARPDATPQLLSGSWAGLRLHARREGQQPAAGAPLTLLLGLSVTHDGRVSGNGRDVLGTFTLSGHIHTPPAADASAAAGSTSAPTPALTRLSLRVSYRECGGLPGELIAHTVRGAAPMAWEGYVWPFGLVGAWAHEAPAPGAPPLWAQGGTWMVWPHDSGGAML
jgi:hypothetical protein